MLQENLIKFKGPNHIFKSIHYGDMALEYVVKEQIKLKSDLGYIKQRPWRYKSPEQTQTLCNIENLYNSREEVVKMFNDYAKNMSGNIYESKKGTGLKIFTPKQMLKGLPIALAQIAVGNNSESLSNEIRQILYSLYQYHVLVLKLIDKLDLRRDQKSVALSNLSIYYTWKNIKSSYNSNKFKISAPTWSNEFELPDGSYSISDIQDYFEYILQKHSENVDNPSIRIYVNKIKNRNTFKIKNGYYLELLTPETMKLLGSTKSKITKDKNGENVPHSEILELVLVLCNLVNNVYQQHSRVLHTFVPNKPFGSVVEISPTNHIF